MGGIPLDKPVVELTLIVRRTASGAIQKHLRGFAQRREMGVAGSQATMMPQRAEYRILDSGLKTLKSPVVV
jgi:hypothetical protein